MHPIRTLSASPPARRALAILLALLLGLSLLPLAAFADSSAQDADLPGPPTNVVASALTPGDIMLTWSPVAGADGYNVYRGTSENGHYTQSGQTTGTNYVDSGLEPDTTYYYVVAAVASGSSGPQSSPVSATTHALPLQQADPNLNTLVMDNYEPYAHEGFGFTATGDRQDATGTANGDTRYVPMSWSISSGLTGFFPNTSPYETRAVIDQPGDYTLTATYTLQRFIPSIGWIPMDSTATVSVDFTVKAHTYELTYLRNYTPEDTVTASGGSYEENSFAPASDIASVGVPGDNWTRSDGYAFGGWLDRDRGVVYQPGEQVPMVRGGVSLVALWGAMPDPGKNTLVLDNHEPYQGEPFTFTATGDRQDEPGTVSGEMRYTPVLWTITTNLYGDFTTPSPYKVSVAIDQPGDYTVKAVFALEQYVAGTGWQRMGSSVTLSENFTVKERLFTLSYFRNHSPEDATVAPGGEYPAGTLVPLSDASELSPDFTRTGYRFVGWNTDRAGNEGVMGNYLMPNGPVSLYAIWAPEYTVTYDGNGADPGTVPVDNSAYLAGDPVNIPVEAPVKTGYAFIGWQNRAAGNVHQPGDRFAMPEGGATLVALWAEQAEQADKGNNTLVIDDDDLTVGEAVRFTATGDRQEAIGDVNGETRYDPVSWTITPLLSNHMPFANQHPFTDSMVMDTPGDYVLTAAFVMRVYDAGMNAWHPVGDLEMISVPFTVKAEAHPLTYLRNHTSDDAWFAPGGDFAAGDAVQPSSIASVGTVHDDWTREGYRFMGWSTDRSATQGTMDAFDMPNGPLTLYAVWAPEYAVTYDGNGHDGGTVPADAFAYIKGDTVTVAAGEPTKAGHVFAGWKADHDGKVYRAGDTFAMPEGGTRLVAQWTPQTGGGQGENPAGGPSAGAPKGAPAALSKIGFLPKTGDEAVPFVLLGAAAAAGALGVRSLRRKMRG